VCAQVEDSGGVGVGTASPAAGSGTITFTAPSGSVFNTTGLKGLAAGWSLTYPII
jgi:hypothetical protein